jgi:hypothetical protein
MIDLNNTYIGLLRQTYFGLFEVEKTNNNYDTNYRRVEMTAIDWAKIEIDNKEVIINACNIIFPDSTSNWGCITHFGIFDKNDNTLLIGCLLSSMIVLKNNRAVIPAGLLQIEPKILEIDNG